MAGKDSGTPEYSLGCWGWGSEAPVVHPLSHPVCQGDKPHLPLQPRPGLGVLHRGLEMHWAGPRDRLRGSFRLTFEYLPSASHHVKGPWHKEAGNLGDSDHSQHRVLAVCLGSLLSTESSQNLPVGPVIILT